MRARITILIVKFIRAGLRLFGRGGSLPGQIALKLDANILKKIKYPSKIILVTGTNGKTTTNNMVYALMRKKYENAICNVRGDNLMAGITTLILNHTSFGLKVQSDCIVIEVDELNVPHVLKNVPVSTILINNFFRDQLDRAGEMENVVGKVGNALATYQGQLVLNGDDPNVVRLADVAPQAEVFYFGVAKNKLSKQVSDEASEGKFCFRCNAVLEYDYYQYSHIGRFHCPNCDFGHHSFYLEATDVDIDKQSFTVDGVVFHTPQDALYAIYNCVGVISIAKLYDISFLVAKEVLEGFELKDGRMEHFDIGRDCLLNLVKNPTGANEVMKYIMRDQEAKDIVIVLNDNVQDGTDISWIWDAHFDLLVDSQTKVIICSGLRAYDMALRLKYENFTGEIIVLPKVEDAIMKLKSLHDHAYVLATYTALQPMRTALRRNQK
ncbi:UDP-N-acetylmuramyl tripeptide synthase [Breznakia sp. PF5-3]|uniref:Mur ligase family protein n=1 Tax=unclassified Breznakia TaxID=2623764 RepID=UPI0024059112|nr:MULTISPECIES: Mur ligase family protein [unclassified Breznakia]MDF9824063.1 UDP-N-acetylmuramyl tripeptide synthase [Breznakia sp. PM6-1]MDF9834871.1 UDP-N-acetylmuramyl tripeptide synthase [Breznakia sp. PF5-3]MDF9837107.1 UDP-N-acetylmuramyl tripeptide synthase [Breznakia sp. PFB2-8]MDF9859032.1 UDP-N-acetylmuramyl tripeptide synthase [Breznakia sp. PH5-24]